MKCPPHKFGKEVYETHWDHDFDTKCLRYQKCIICGAEKTIQWCWNWNWKENRESPGEPPGEHPGEPPYDYFSE